MKHANPGPETLSPAMFHILLSLAEGEKHGYAIMRDVVASKGEEMGPGTLYGAIKRMLEAGWIEESDERPDPELDDHRRRYYRLSPRGRAMADAEARRMAQLVKLARTRGLGTLPIIKPA